MIYLWLGNKELKGTGKGMAEQTYILDILNERYSMDFDTIEFIRDSGCMAYAVYANGCKYFLRVTKPMYCDTASKSLDIHLFLQKQEFSVPRIIFTKDGSPYVNISDESGKYYYLDRYINILREKGYDKVDEFIAYGELLWDKVKDLPYGYCHGDLYRGNILKTTDGCLYILDFDTSCEGFPMYDPALICNITDYFELEDDGCIKSKNVYERFLSEYLKYSSLSKVEIESFYDLIALYHFAL